MAKIQLDAQYLVDIGGERKAVGPGLVDADQLDPDWLEKYKLRREVIKANKEKALAAAEEEARVAENNNKPDPADPNTWKNDEPEKLPENFPGVKQLAAANITTYTALTLLSEDDLDEIQGIGPATIADIQQALKEYLDAKE
jgi:DNA uptake protein ComE-like DNA-binding protein